MLGMVVDAAYSGWMGPREVREEPAEVLLRPLATRAELQYLDAERCLLRDPAAIVDMAGIG